MKYFLVPLSAAFALLTGCVEVTPMGNQTYHLECDGAMMNWSTCYKKAAQLCPAGFQLVGRAGSGTQYGWNLWTGFSGSSDTMKEIIVRCDDSSMAEQSAPCTTAALRGEDLKTVGDFVVSEGQMVPFVLTYSASHLPPPEPVDAPAALVDTEAYWRANGRAAALRSANGLRPCAVRSSR